VQTPENFEVVISVDELAGGVQGSKSLFEVSFVNAPFGYPNMVAYAWCIDYERQITDGIYFADLYSSYEDDFPKTAVDRPGNLKMLTWMLNHYDVGDTIESCNNATVDFEDIQIAVWKIVDNETMPTLLSQGNTIVHDDCISTYLADQAGQHPDYEPSCGNGAEIVPVMIVVDDGEIITHQVIVAEILMSDLCECPVVETGDACYQLGDGTTTTHEFAGFVCFNTAGSELVVDFDIRENYELMSTAVWVGSDIADMPALGDGSPDWTLFPDVDSVMGQTNHTVNVPIDMSTSCSGQDTFTFTVVTYADVLDNVTISDDPQAEVYGMSSAGSSGDGWSYIELTVECMCGSVTAVPSSVPTDDIKQAPPAPGASPTTGPSDSPSDIPSDQPSDAPSDVPSDVPSDLPSDVPSDVPSAFPSDDINLVPPVLLATPSSGPLDQPSDVPTFVPTDSPSDVPTFVPTDSPTLVLRRPPLPFFDPTSSPTYDTMVCECLDPFISIPPVDFTVKNKIYYLDDGSVVNVLERRVTVDGKTYTDAVYFTLGDSSSTFEVTAYDDYYINGNLASLPNSFVGYPITLATSTYRDDIVVDFGGGSKIVVRVFSGEGIRNFLWVKYQ